VFKVPQTTQNYDPAQLTQQCVYRSSPALSKVYICVCVCVCDPGPQKNSHKGFYFVEIMIYTSPESWINNIIM